MTHILIVDDNPLDRELARGLIDAHNGWHGEYASNGVEALEHLEASTPLAIVTDLQMPELDGLALVRAVRRLYPSIPIILMTAHGSEEIALEALVEGASDYVPKHRLAADLPRVIESVLAIASGNRPHGEVTCWLQYKQIRYAVPCDSNLIPVLVDQLQQAAYDFGLVDSASRVRLAKCLAEALRNAMNHGCRSPGASTAAGVQVAAELSPSEAKFVVRDPGAGFNTAALVSPRQAPSQLTADTGRGLALIQLFMDEVRFNDLGNEITLIKRKLAVK